MTRLTVRSVVAALCLALSAPAFGQQIAHAEHLVHPWVQSQCPLNVTGLVYGPGDGVPRIVGSIGADLYFGAMDMTTGLWSTELVALAPFGGPSLAVDLARQPHVAFNGSSQFGVWGDLMYASRTMSGWTIQTVDSAVKYGYDTSIGVDSAGVVHILGKQEQDGNLWYWTNAGGVWTGEIVDANSNPGRYSDMVVDASGTPHIVYSTWSPLSDPRYAVRIGPNNWQVTTLDLSTDTYRSLSLDLDSQGHVHVVYHDGDNALYYITFDGNSWSPRQLIFVGGGKYASIAVDRFDRVHIVVHTSSVPTEVYWFTRSAQGMWTEPLFVAYGSVVGAGDALDTDAFGRPWLCLRDNLGQSRLFTR